MMTAWYAARMPAFEDAIAKHADFPETKQREIAKAVAGKMKKPHTDFLKDLLALIKDKKIDPMDPESFINKKVYDKMPQEWKGKTDLALVNIASQIQQIDEFYKDEATPTASPELENMIEHLWQMKQRIEETYDVFKF